jgi:hypothetical protein
MLFAMKSFACHSRYIKSRIVVKPLHSGDSRLQLAHRSRRPQLLCH